MKLEGQLDVVEYSRILYQTGRSGRGLCGDAEGEEFRERAPDGLEREASHAGVSEGADGELQLEQERIRHGDVLGSKRNLPGKIARDLLEGGPPKIL